MRLDEGEYKGKLVKLERSLQELVGEGLLATDYEATIVLYLASQRRETTWHPRSARPIFLHGTFELCSSSR